MKNIVLKNIKKSYGSNEVVKGLDFEIKSGERLVLLGPSGCGKSTTLRMIAGLEDITSGDLWMNETRMNDIECGKRNVAMVFQNYSLYPHMTVEKNITYGLIVNKVNKSEIQQRLNKVLKMLELVGLENRLPRDLSGGQRQRVALARAIVKQSDYFLLDEPLSNLDAQLRVVARKELVKIHETFKQTMVYVTHDQVEAMAIGHRIAILHKGILQMVDTPENVYYKPANTFVAKFIGSPSMNLIHCVVENGVLHFMHQQISINETWANYIEQSGLDSLQLGIRPEHLQLTKEKVVDSLKVTVKYVENYGENYGVHVQFEMEEFVVISDHKNWASGETIYMSMELEKAHFFRDDTDENIGYPNTENTNKLLEEKVCSNV